MWKCDTCGWEQRKWFGICPQCKNGTAEEVEAAPFPASKAGRAAAAKAYPTVDFKAVDAKSTWAPQPPMVVTPWKDLNRVIGTAEGFVKGQVVVLAASPGVGKSTLCTELAGANALYISSEESWDQVNDRFRRVHPTSGAVVVSTQSEDAVYGAIDQTDKDLIIVDSVNNIEWGASYAKTAKIVQKITAMIKESGKVGILISQVTKKGDIIGMTAIEHVVDTVMFMEKSAVSSDVIATCRKNRFGEVGNVALLQHEENGFVESPNVVANEPAVGSTICPIRFGYRTMKVAVDALAADARGTNTIQRSSGYSASRVQQVLAVLDYQSKLGIGKNRDLYVSISQGLMVTDTSADLAVAHSILSSYFEKSLVTEAQGELSLNGTIRNGMLDGRQVHHVQDLIRLYKH